MLQCIALLLWTIAKRQLWNDMNKIGFAWLDVTTRLFLFDVQYFGLSSWYNNKCFGNIFAIWIVSFWWVSEFRFSYVFFFYPKTAANLRIDFFVYFWGIRYSIWKHDVFSFNIIGKFTMTIAELKFRRQYGKNRRKYHAEHWTYYRKWKCPCFVAEYSWT